MTLPFYNRRFWIADAKTRSAWTPYRGLFAVRRTVIAVAKTASVRRHVVSAHGLDGENRMGGGRSKGLRGMWGMGVGTRDAAGGSV